MTVVTLLFIGLVLAGGWQLRGSDQYWYITDTETLLAGRPSVAGHVFPRQFFESGFEGRPHFIHNALGLYLALPLSSIFGPVLGWTLTNCLVAIAAAAVVGFTVRRLTGRDAACLAYGLALAYPAVYWQATQPLLETSCTIFSALAGWFLVKTGDRPRNWGWVALSLAGLVLCRMSFLPVLAVLPFVFLFYSRPVNARRLLVTVGLVGATVAVVVVAKQLLPNGMPTSVRDLLANGGTDGGDNMAFLFTLEGGALDAGRIATKAAQAISQQFPLNSLGLFYWPFNLAAGLAVVGLFRRPAQSPEYRLSLLASGMIGIHVLQIVLHQNQFRYLVPGFPVILAAAVVNSQPLWKWLTARRQTLQRPPFVPSVAAILTILFVLDAALMLRLVNDGRRCTAAVAEVRQQLTGLIPTDATLLVDAQPSVFADQLLMVEYAAQPRRVAYIRSNYTHPQYAALLSGLQPSHVLASSESQLLKQLPASLAEVAVPVTEGLPGWRLYRIDAPISFQITDSDASVETPFRR
ncbi:MAG: DUF2079 domain-containing protein [Planctomycetaceae bacterium]|nr:DUF2079 domain-containing protein [Planctomycetaceae bacterium]